MKTFCIILVLICQPSDHLGCNATENHKLASKLTIELIKQVCAKIERWRIHIYIFFLAIYRCSCYCICSLNECPLLSYPMEPCHFHEIQTQEAVGVADSVVLSCTSFTTMWCQNTLSHHCKMILETWISRNLYWHHTHLAVQLPI